MTNAITVTIPHKLGLEAAKKRVAERIEALRREYVDKVAHSEVSWSGDVAALRVSALGQTATAQITVLADQLRIDVQLPWILATLTGKIKDFALRNADEVLRLPPPKK